MKKQRLLIIGLVIILISAIGTYFFQEERKEVPPEPEQRQMTRIKFGLSWVHQAQFSGEYYADQNGFFQEAGIDITLVPATIDKDPLEALLNGELNFVIGQPDSLIKARSNGAKIKAIAATYRIHPMIISSLPEKGIFTPRDLIGKTVGVAYSEELILIAMLKNQGIDPKEVNIVTRDYNFTNLVNGNLDAQAAWITDEIQRAKSNNLILNNMLPSDYGVLFYADVIIATEQMIQNNPKLVGRFLKAILDGWNKVIADPEENAKLTLIYNAELDLSHEINVLESSIPLIHTGTHSIGWMKHEDWKNMYQIMVDQGILKNEFSPEDLYTMQFLE